MGGAGSAHSHTQAGTLSERLEWKMPMQSWDSLCPLSVTSRRLYLCLWAVVSVRAAQQFSVCVCVWVPSSLSFTFLSPLRPFLRSPLSVFCFLHLFVVFFRWFLVSTFGCTSANSHVHSKCWHSGAKVAESEMEMDAAGQSEKFRFAGWMIRPAIHKGLSSKVDMELGATWLPELQNTLYVQIKM